MNCSNAHEHVDTMACSNAHELLFTGAEHKSYTYITTFLSQVSAG